MNGSKGTPHESVIYGLVVKGAHSYSPDKPLPAGPSFFLAPALVTQWSDLAVRHPSRRIGLRGLRLKMRSKFNKSIHLFKQIAGFVLKIVVRFIGVLAIGPGLGPTFTMVETPHNRSNINMIPHYYYPPTIRLPHYSANETSVLSLITQFGFLWAAVLGIAFIVIRRTRPTVSRSDQLSFIWMCLSTLP